MTKSCCQIEQTHEDHHSSKRDWVMWVSAPLVLFPLLLLIADPATIERYGWLSTYVHSVHEFVAASWWGVALGILFLSLMSGIPREFVMSVLGNNKGANGILRAMGAGVLFDLCNHGILMIASKLYQRGASIGQVMAFLIASPWNSLSLTFILIALIGLKLTLVFIAFSCVIAFISGMLFDAFVRCGTLPPNPNAFDMPENFKFWPEARQRLSATRWTPALFKNMLLSGVKDSQIVLRWLLAGIVLASLLRVFIDPATFAQYFGPTMLGMLATLLFATLLEVCSEGSSPIAADLVTRAGAPGNAFTFLMAGASTDYTEIMVMKDTTRSWKIALFLPLVTVPQIVALGFLLNL
jgi:uncharacterized protein